MYSNPLYLAHDRSDNTTGKMKNTAFFNDNISIAIFTGAHSYWGIKWSKFKDVFFYPYFRVFGTSRGLFRCYKWKKLHKKCSEWNDSHVGSFSRQVLAELSAFPCFQCRSRLENFLIKIMWIQVRSFDGKTTMQVDNLSKLTKIEDLRSRLIDTFNAPPDCQRLFYRGKQVRRHDENIHVVIVEKL